MTTRIVCMSIALAFTTLVTPAAFAQTSLHDHHASHMMAGEELTPAEIRALDTQAGKITLRHGDLKNLGMPGMTMVFTLGKQLALPAGLKTGDKVFVRVEDLGGTLTVTTLKR